MATSELVVLPQTEAEYATWVQDHSHGFIINAPKQGNGNMMWHRVGCSYLAPYGEWRYVEGDHLKACSMHAGALAIWAKHRPEELAYCQECCAAVSKSS